MSGSEVIGGFKSATRSYTLTCTNGTGSTAKTVRVTATEFVPIPGPDPSALEGVEQGVQVAEAVASTPEPIKSQATVAESGKHLARLTRLTTLANVSAQQGGTQIIIQRVTYSIAGQAVAIRVSGDPVAGNNGLFYLYSDQLGSTSAMQAPDGTVRQTRYTPFGDYRDGSGSNPITDRGYTGQKENMGLGLMYYNARYYIPSLGRFASADTIVPDPTNPQTFNRYSYVNNNPVRYTDPTGHCVFGLPCPEPIQNGILVVGEFSLGVSAEYYYNNSFGLLTTLEPNPSESTAMKAGRVVGDVATIVQGTAEINGGAGLMGGGVLACAGTGVACAATPAAEIAGGAMVLHGGALGLQGTKQLAENGQLLLSEIMSGGSGGAEPPSYLNKNARSTDDVDEIFRRLEKNNGVSREDASLRLHDIKRSTGRGGADNVLFDMSGNVYNPDTLEWIGSLTAGGGSK